MGQLIKSKPTFLYPNLVVEVAIRAFITDRRGTVRGVEVLNTFRVDWMDWVVCV